MKVRVKVAFYDDNGIHRVGDIVEVKAFDENHMELVEEKKPAVKKAKKED